MLALTVTTITMLTLGTLCGTGREMTLISFLSPSYRSALLSTRWQQVVESLVVLAFTIWYASKHNSRFANESSFGRKLYAKVLHVYCTLKSRLIFEACTII